MRYRLAPAIAVPWAYAVHGWDGVRAALAQPRLIIDACPGVDIAALATHLARPDAPIIRTTDLLLPEADLRRRLEPWLGGGDPVLALRCPLPLTAWFDPDRLAAARRRAAEGPVLVVGPGATLVSADGHVVLADLSRWEAQLRQRAGRIGSLGCADAGARPAALYRHAFFADWRAWDAHKTPLLASADAHLDTEATDDPRLCDGATLRGALDHACTTPFRLVPYFDAAPWGGQWMRRVCGLPDGPPNYGWAFDGVPEENALRFDLGGTTFTIPAQSLVLARPRALLGEAVHGRFGAEFPIRFDFLDTMGGGNLSLQVHPLTEYIQRHFGWAYTQDESYYLLDAEPGAQVYLGLKEGVDAAMMAARLREAQAGGRPFPADEFAQRWPAKAHDHFLIPAGTVHCSGAGAMVLEISATPYIFTFKLWDWERLGLDSRPRPVHLDHGLANIQWDRTTAWTAAHLVNRREALAGGDGWTAERTGLHEREFIDTIRHRGHGAMPHHTRGGVHMLNLVAGDGAVVESPTGAFAPFAISYAETFIVPAAVGAYTVRPRTAGCAVATIEASVRTGVLPCVT
ncbi:MAG: hypothetical protein RLZZ127_3204 [Planctomycetota bacterium]|jgi:hypothetical protein